MSTRTDNHSYTIRAAAELTGLPASTLRYYESIGVIAPVGLARAYQPELLKLVLDGSIDPGKVFDLTIDLDHIADGYAAMDERRAIKALVKVSNLRQTG